MLYAGVVVCVKRMATTNNHGDETMQFVKTLPNGNKVFSTVEMIESPHAWEAGQKRATGFRLELNAAGETVRKWQPGFAELAGHSPTTKRFGC